MGFFVEHIIGVQIWLSLGLSGGESIMEWFGWNQSDFKITIFLNCDLGNRFSVLFS